MKRTIGYIAILAALFAAPVEQMEVGKLIPVQAISIYRENDYYVLETNTGNKGTGDTLELALENMKDTASGTIYLDTAQYLLFTDGAKEAPVMLRQKLKRNVRMAELEAPVEMDGVAQFLDAHGKLPKLKNWKTGAELPVLSKYEDSYIFLKKVENNA